MLLRPSPGAGGKAALVPGKAPAMAFWKFGTEKYLFEYEVVVPVVPFTVAVVVVAVFAVVL